MTPGLCSTIAMYFNNVKDSTAESNFLIVWLATVLILCSRPARGPAQLTRHTTYCCR